MVLLVSWIMFYIGFRTSQHYATYTNSLAASIVSHDIPSEFADHGGCYW